MRIGLDVREAEGQPAGKGRVVRELAQVLPTVMPKDEFVFYAKKRFPLETPANVTWREVGGKSVLWHRNVAKRANKECDVYLSTTSYVTPRWLKIPIALVVYDLISFKDFAIPQRRAKAIERATLGPAVEKAAAILTISEATARDLTGLFPAAKGKVTVMPLAADDRFKAAHPKKELDAVRERYGLAKPYVFYAGTLEPRKNLVELVRAYSELPEKLRNKYDLVLAGKKGWDYESIFVAIEQFDLQDHVKHLDYVPDDDLAKLYAAAEVFAFPSLYEGFGLPVLEAMQSGTPVLTSDLSSLPEVGDDAVLYVDPTSDRSVEGGLEKLLSSAALRRTLKASGAKRAKKYSWKRTAEIAAEALRGL